MALGVPIGLPSLFGLRKYKPGWLQNKGCKLEFKSPFSSSRTKEIHIIYLFIKSIVRTNPQL